MLLAPFSVTFFDGLHFADDYSPAKKFKYDLSNGENPLGFSPTVKQAISEKFSKMSSYPEAEYRGLVRALSAHHKMPEDNFVVTCGSNGALLAAVSTFMAPGKNMVMPHLAFPTPAMETAVRGGRVIAVPMRNDMQTDLAGLKQAVTNDTALIYLANPNNPTGLYIPAEEIRNLARSVNVPVLVSEANVEYAGASVIEGLDMPDNLISARSFSKAYGLAGMRVGYAVCTPNLARRIIRDMSPNLVSSISQIAAEAALADQDYLKKSISYMATERSYVSENLERIGFKVLPAHANNILAVVPDAVPSSTWLFQKLAERDCTVVDGANYPGLSNRCIRVVPRTRDVNDAFLARTDDALKCI